MARYCDFFALFEDFRGYVDFWLLQDLVDDNYSAVRYLMPFNEFKPPAKPQDLDAYRENRRLSIEFVQPATAASTPSKLPLCLAPGLARLPDS